MTYQPQTMNERPIGTIRRIAAGLIAIGRSSCHPRESNARERTILTALLIAFNAVAPSSQAVTPGKPLHSLGVTLAEDGGAYYEQITRGAESAAKAINPAVHYTARSCKNDAASQIQQIDEFVKTGTDLIVIQRSYRGDSSPAVQRARKAGVVVIAIDADIPGGADATVKPDERQGGVLAAKSVATALPTGGTVAIANGPATSDPLQSRVAGFLDELKDHPAIAVVDNQDTGMTREGTHKAIAEILARHPSLSAIYAVNDRVAYYAEEEAVRSGRTNLFIVGMEGSPRSVAAMKDPARLITASPGADPFTLAETAVKVGAAILAGKDHPAEPILLPFAPVTRANVEGFTGWTK